MSNHLAIATVTATLQRILQNAIQADVEGAKVTTTRPGDSGSGTPEAGVNIYLYDVKHNPAWRSTADSSNRRTRGEVVKPRVGIDLYYLLSFYGNDVALEAQRLLGSVISTLQERRVLTKQMILDTVADPAFAFLTDSNLAEQLQTVTLILLDLPAEERSNIWSVFFQSSHNLSVVYHATAVLIEGEDIRERALPVRDRSFGPVIFAQAPVIERIVSQAGAYQPILVDSTLLVYGKQLNSEVTLVRIGGVEATPHQVSETQIGVQLSSVPVDSLRAGVQSLQVVHQVVEATPNGLNTTRQPLRYRKVESNAAAFVLHPTITDVNVSNLEGSGNELRSGDLRVEVNLAIGKTQRVVVLLNEQSTNTRALAYSFAVRPREVDTNSIMVAINDVKAGSYLVRLQVDGAESPLEVGTEPENPTFNGYIRPKIVIS